MEVVRKGKSPKTRTYYGACGGCDSELKFTAEDVVAQSVDLYTGWVRVLIIECPVCEAELSLAHTDGRGGIPTPCEKCNSTGFIGVSNIPEEVAKAATILEDIIEDTEERKEACITLKNFVNSLDGETATVCDCCGGGKKTWWYGVPGVHLRDAISWDSPVEPGVSRPDCLY